MFSTGSTALRALRTRLSMGSSAGLIAWSKNLLLGLDSRNPLGGFGMFWVF